MEMINEEALLDVDLRHDESLEASKARFIDAWGRDLYDEAMQEQNGVLIPPWEKFPLLSRSSIGWRMGNGETYRSAYSLLQLPKFKTRRGLVNFLASRPHRVPMSWVTLLLMDLQCETENECNAMKNILVQRQIVGYDVSFGAFKAQAKPRPLLWRGSFSHVPPNQRFELYPRMTCFKLRWYREEPISDDELVDINTEWQPIVDILRKKADAIPPLGENPYDYMCRCFAMHGTVSAPWKEPSSTTAYVDAWFSWANHYFDDIPTWVDYLKTQHPIPSEWKTRLLSDQETFYQLVFLDSINYNLQKRIREGDKSVQMFEL